MSSLRPIALIFAACLVMPACAPVFNVSRGGDPKGLPFYLKSIRYRQHTTYQYDWSRVSLAIIPIQKPATATTAEVLGTKSVRVADIALTDKNRTALERLRSAVENVMLNPGSSPEDAKARLTQEFAALTRLPDNHLNAPAASALRRTANYVERVSIVDYDAVYYLNGKIPPFGSNTLNTELAADGTLAKGSATVTGGVGDAIGTIASALTGIAPIKEFLTTRWTPAATEAVTMKTPDPGVSFRVELSVEGQSVIYDFTADTKADPGSPAPLAPDFDKISFTSRAADKPAEKPAEEGITFSGKVVMPPKKP